MTYKERNAGVKENEQPGYYISLAKGYMQKAYEEYSRITGNEFAPRIKKQDPKIEAIGQRLKKEMMELARVVEKAGFGETEFYRNVLYAAGDLIKDSSNLEGFFAAWNGYFSKEISESEFSSSGKTQLRIRQNIESMANPEKRKAAYEFLKNYAVQMNKKNGTKEDGFPEHVFFDDGNMRMTVRYSEETGRLVLRA